MGVPIRTTMRLAVTMAVIGGIVCLWGGLPAGAAGPDTPGGVQNFAFRLIGRQRLASSPPVESGTTANSDLAMDASGPDHLVAVFQEGEYPDQGAMATDYATSLNAGLSWTQGVLPGLTAAGGGPYQRAANARVAFGMNGAVFASSQVLDPSACASGVAVNASLDDGQIWRAPVFVDRLSSCGTTDDMTGIVVDGSVTSPHSGRIYVAWDRLQNGNGPVMLAHSDDGGTTWSAPGQVTPLGVSGLAPQPLVEPDGTVIVYYAWPSTLSEMIQTSSDGGSSFGLPSLVNVFTGSDPSGMRTGAGQGIGDATIDPVTGTAYIVWADLRGDNHVVDAIDMSRSTDDGMTWSQPIVLSNTTADAIDRFTPGVGAFGGVVAATWYHLYTDPSGKTHLNRGFSFSTNGGTTWSKALMIVCKKLHLSIDLSHAAVVGGLRFLGDYQSTVTTTTAGHPAWTVASPSPSTYNQGTWTATMQYTGSRGGAADPGPGC